MDRNESWKSDLRYLGVLAGLCLIVGVWLICKLVLINNDGLFYISQSRIIIEEPLTVARRHPPGYPALLRLAHDVVRPFASNDSTALWIYSAQGVTLLCRMLAIIVLYLLGKRLIGAKNSFRALLILILLPTPTEAGSDVLREWPYILFLSLGFLLLLRGLQEERGGMLGWAGLVIGLGYLIRPECAQLVLCGLFALAVVRFAGGTTGGWKRLVAASLLIVGFGVAAVPYALATGTILPQQLRSAVSPVVPAISAVGPKAAAPEPLEFEAPQGDLLELPIKASIPRGGPVTFALVGVPTGSRPIYQFRSPSTGECLWTVLGSEKDTLIANYAQEVWDYEGVAGYAYAQPEARPGLLPVRRFWSAVRQQRLYVANMAETDTLLKAYPDADWHYEGIIFYAFGEDARPDNAVPVYRFWSERKGYSWAVGNARARTADGTVAYYVHPGGPPPTGAVIENGVLRWRPDPDQEGDYQVNIIVSDGRLETCQLMKIKVISRRRIEHAGWAKLPEAMDKFFDAIVKDFAMIFFVPWFLGLWHRLQNEALRPERVLMIAFLAVNIALMLSRYAWIAVGDNKRYAISLVALTIFYVPVGLGIIAQGLGFLPLWRQKRVPPQETRESWCFHAWAVAGAVICLLRIVAPAPGDDKSCRAMAQWLRANTKANDVIATDDRRIGFYADRTILYFDQYPDSQRADYVVEIRAKDQAQTPEGWHEEYAVPLTGKKKDRMLAVYRVARSP